MSNPWSTWLLAFALASPWIVLVAWFLRKDGGNREVPPSMAEMARKRLWTS
jgi:hypothetical protein